MGRISQKQDDFSKWDGLDSKKKSGGGEKERNLGRKGRKKNQRENRTKKW